MKTCSKCGIQKSLDEFNKRSSSKDGRQANCRQCNSNNLKEHYDSNKDYYKDKQKKMRLDNTRHIVEYKSQHPCINCGEDDTVCLDFHHISDKTFNLAEAPYLGISKASIDEEIKKCVVLCSNCHRKLHAGKINIAV